uniref:Uncharacterized protein n=1 Tax=Ditylenchus dipsaci TaxID=166011 RepID=A0A915CQ11_9BILA
MDPAENAFKLFKEHELLIVCLENSTASAKSMKRHLKTAHDLRIRLKKLANSLPKKEKSKLAKDLYDCIDMLDEAVKEHTTSAQNAVCRNGVHSATWFMFLAVIFPFRCAYNATRSLWNKSKELLICMDQVSGMVKQSQ